MSVKFVKFLFTPNVPHLSLLFLHALSVDQHLSRVSYYSYPLYILLIFYFLASSLTFPPFSTSYLYFLFSLVSISPLSPCFASYQPYSFTQQLTFISTSSPHLFSSFFLHLFSTLPPFLLPSPVSPSSLLLLNPHPLPFPSSGPVPTNVSFL